VSLNIESKPASLTSRVVAFALDYLLICLYLIILAAITMMVTSKLDSDAWTRFFSDPIRADIVAFLVTVLPVAAYFSITESSIAQASWGKRKRRLRVESTDGTRLSLRAAMVRSLLKLIPWQIAHTSLFNIPGWPTNTGSPPGWVVVGLVLVWVIVAMYAFSVVFQPSHQSIYDRLVGARVVSLS